MQGQRVGRAAGFLFATGAVATGTGATVTASRQLRLADLSCRAKASASLARPSFWATDAAPQSASDVHRTHLERPDESGARFRQVAELRVQSPDLDEARHVPPIQGHRPLVGGKRRDGLLQGHADLAQPLPGLEILGRELRGLGGGLLGFAELPQLRVPHAKLVPGVGAVGNLAGPFHAVQDQDVPVAGGLEVRHLFREIVVRFVRAFRTFVRGCRSRLRPSAGPWLRAPPRGRRARVLARQVAMPGTHRRRRRIPVRRR